MNRILAGSLALLWSASLTAADVRILSPANDELVFDATIEVRGAASTDSTDGGTVTLTVGETSFSATVQNGQWRVPNVALPSGLSILEAKVSNASNRVLVVRAGAALGPRPQQLTRFRWNAGVDDELRLIASGTLSSHFNDTQLQDFIDTIKRRVPEILVERYSGVANVKLVGDEGPETHTIEMLSASNTLFGDSPPDCGSQIAGQTTRVFVGTYRDSMVTDFDLWGPMKKSDSLELRAEDVSHALGRTAVHELAHSLGLVGGGAADPCSWLDGCDLGHNCERFDDVHPEADRFDSGRYIMDPGPKTLNRTRLAELNSNARTSRRIPSHFNAFNKSYLRLVHPLP